MQALPNVSLSWPLTAKCCHTHQPRDFAVLPACCLFSLFSMGVPSELVHDACLTSKVLEKWYVPGSRVRSATRCPRSLVHRSGQSALHRHSKLHHSRDLTCDESMGKSFPHGTTSDKSWFAFTYRSARAGYCSQLSTVPDNKRPVRVHGDVVRWREKLLCESIRTNCTISNIPSHG